MTVNDLIIRLMELTPEQRAMPVKIKDECWCCGAYEVSYVHVIESSSSTDPFVGIE